MKRIGALLLVFSLLSAFVFANGDGESTQTITLRMLTRTAGADPAVPLWEDAIAEFQALHPEVIIQDDSVNQEAAYSNIIKTGFATGNLPNFFYDGGTVGMVKYAKEGVIQDISPAFDDAEWYNGFAEGTFDNWKFDSFGAPGYYAFPHAMSPEAIVYNKKLFAQAGIEKTPETWNELLVAIDQLNAAGIVPWEMGGAALWRTGHLHNYIMYKWCGVQKAIDLGTRQAKWTDSDVVETFQFIKDLKARGAFRENFEGLDYDMEKSLFLAGESAMVLNGVWFAGEVSALENSEDFGTFHFPYFEEKPEFKGHMVCYPEGYYVKAGMDEEELALTIEFLKLWTSKKIQARKVKELKMLSPRVDLGLTSEDLNEVLVGYSAVFSDSTMLGSDIASYDPLSEVGDQARNSVIGMLLGQSAEEAAASVQAVIDNN
ncbi:MAG: extracellular solute-binding protein [Spirochaetales bacterium]|nr:extracellular solute-binding protein [Spirochaetales bacterium]